MDPNILSIILAVVANGFTSLITYLGHQTGKSLIGKEFLEKWELEKTALQPILHKAIIGVEEETPWQGPPPLEVTCLFLLTPEVEAFVRQIFSTKLSGDKKRNNLEAIQKEFLASFSLYTDIEKEQ